MTRIKNINTVLLSFVFIMLTATFASAADTTIYIPDVSIKSGDSITVPIMINNAEDVKGAHISLNYDPSVVYVTYLGNSDFNFETFKDVNNSTGSACYVVVNIANGLDGNVKFADVTLKAVGSEGDMSSLSLDVVALSDGESESQRTVDSGKFIIESSSSTSVQTGGGSGSSSGGSSIISVGKVPVQDDVSVSTPEILEIPSRTVTTVSKIKVTEPPSIPTQQTSTPPPTEALTPPTSWILISGAVFLLVGSSIASYFISRKR